MDRPIFCYEVVLKVTPKTAPPVSTTRTEHAYSISEAVYQAILHTLNSYPGAEIAILRIGPPEDAIQRASGDLVKEVAAEVSALLTAQMKERARSATDAVGLMGATKATVARKI